MQNFIYHIPTKIYFGKGEIKALGRELKGRFRKILIVTGRGSVKKSGVFNAVVREVKKAGVLFVELAGVKPNPRLRSVYEGIKVCRDAGVDFILALGGGSVIDASKAIAAGVKYKGDVWDFFTKGVSCTDAVPIGTVLTLAATGSEMNTYAVITKEDTERKLAFGSSCVRPVFSILDPEYTYTVNAYHTAAGVADIMAHIFEEYFCAPSSSAVQDRMAEALLKVCVRYGPIVCKKPRDYEARANILWTGTLALNGLLGSGKAGGDWACHSIEHEVSAIYDISHGVGLAIIVPNWMKFVLSGKTADKFAEYGVNVWGIDKNKSTEELANAAITETRNFFNSLGLPSRLSEVSVPAGRFQDMAKGAVKAHGRVGSFKNLSEDDIVKILKMSL
jgi:alcohol dehydrogenase YqhD (iron-dependent ADH family)